MEKWKNGKIINKLYHYFAYKCRVTIDLINILLFELYIYNNYIKYNSIILFKILGQRYLKKYKFF